MAPIDLLLTHHRCPGDIVAMTALVRDLALVHPGRYRVAVKTSAMDLWRHNPYIVPAGQLRAGHAKHRLDYGVHLNRTQKHEAMHFVRAFHADFQTKTGVAVPLQRPYGDLHLSAEERQTSLVAGRYWVIISGGKLDFTIKVWHPSYFQRTVDALLAKGLQFVQIGSSDRNNWHPPLTGVLNLLGKTNLRDMLRLIYHADGVICGVTSAMHMAAALQRPCVCIAGGRESWWWEAYVRENSGLAGLASTLTMPHRFLHTIGLLDCCRRQGCWRNRVVPINGSQKGLCKLPVSKGDDYPLAACMDMITPAHVEAAVMTYYEDGSLPPIGAAPHRSESLAPALAAAPLPEFLDPFADAPAPAAAAPIPAAPLNFTTLQLQAPLEGRQRVALPAVKPTPLTPAPRPSPRRPAPRLAQQQQALQRGLPRVTPGQRAVITAPNEAALDDPIIGGKFTVFVLLYGNYYDMHRRCLESLMASVPPQRMELRIGSNALGDESLALVEQLVRDGRCAKHYRHVENALKYPVMREMFHDPTLPITTNYLIWLDDDSICDKNPHWLSALAAEIVRSHNASATCRMFGPVCYAQLTDKQLQWVRQATWYKGRLLQDKRREESPNGRKIHFCVGAFWAMHVPTMQACDVPDARIGHNGGDYMVGMQLWQNGFSIKQFNQNKQHVSWSAYQRRGAHHRHTGT